MVAEAIKYINLYQASLLFRGVAQMRIQIFPSFDSLFWLFKKRDRVTIIADILKSVRYNPTGKRKTKIMQSANLSFEQMNKYLDLLLRNGYVIVDGQMYKPTSRGLAFLDLVEADYLKMKTQV
jgi:predicted transcriptional regulator